MSEANLPLTDVVAILLREVKTQTGRCAKKKKKSQSVSTQDHSFIQGLPDIPEREFTDIATSLLYTEHQCRCGNHWTEIQGIFVHQVHDRSHTTKWVSIQPAQVEAFPELPKEKILREILLHTFCLRCWEA